TRGQGSNDHRWTNNCKILLISLKCFLLLKNRYLQPGPALSELRCHRCFSGHGPVLKTNMRLRTAIYGIPSITGFLSSKYRNRAITELKQGQELVFGLARISVHSRTILRYVQEVGLKDYANRKVPGPEESARQMGKTMSNLV
ncbi:hypothetical protein BGZ65_010614, partial [Modicella reniformis]